MIERIVRVMERKIYVHTYVYVERERLRTKEIISYVESKRYGE
jgi:hypothetical protein